MQIKSLFTFWGSRTTVPAHYRVEVAFEQEPRLGDVDPEGELTREEQDAEVARARALPLFWQHVSRWTEESEARAEALRLLRAFVEEVRGDIMAPESASAWMLPSLRVDEGALTVAWVAGSGDDETLVWRRTWRVERIDAPARVEDPSVPETPETDYVRCGEVCDAHVDGDVVQVAVSATPVDLDAVRVAVETTLGVEIGALRADRWECVDGADNPAVRVQRVAALGHTGVDAIRVSYPAGERAGTAEDLSHGHGAVSVSDVETAQLLGQTSVMALSESTGALSRFAPGEGCYVWHDLSLVRARVERVRYASGDSARANRAAVTSLSPWAQS